jgi:protein phosphatase
MLKCDYRRNLTSLIQPFVPLIEGFATPIIPIVESETVIQLCKDVKMNFKKAPPLLELESPVIVFGDIHGHALDLVRFINEFIMNPEFNDFKFLFLGDLVDRGEFSVENIIMIFLLIVTKSDKVFCIRGNHEFDEVARTNGFYTQIFEIYPSETGTRVYHFFLSAFDWMPFSAKIDSNILCIHGGISSLLVSVDQLAMLERPYRKFSDQMINDILWSDPRNVVDFKNSERGFGSYFGEAALKKFLSNNKLDLLVRAHECVYESKYMHDNKCLTIFGASNYCGESGNKSSVLMVCSNKERKIHNFNPIKYLRRREVVFKKNVNHVQRLSSTPSIFRRILSLNERQNKVEPKKKLSLLSYGS